jgi:hypothetical protein
MLALTAGGGIAQAITVRDFEHPASTNPYQVFGPGNDQRQDTPNDPNYDQAEPDTLNSPTSSNFYDERFDLFGFNSSLTASALYKDPFDQGEPEPDGNFTGSRNTMPQISGFNAAGAWKLERGRPDVTVAILDTGIKWDNQGLRDRVHLNTGELPYPDTSGPALESGVDCTTYTPGQYDANGDGAVNVEDYACDPRVSVTWSGRQGPTGLVTGQDVLHAFGTCKITAHAIDPTVGCPAGGQFDNDGNGYANDIVGWNFFDNSNDPTDRSSYFAAENHGSGRANDAVERGNDGQGSIGVCPHCQVEPLRVWDTFVSDGNTFGQAMTYAADNGVKVIEGADGSLYHSAFAEAASQYAYDKGAVQTYSGDDLNTGNHNYPGNYSHAMLIQGTVPDSIGLGQAFPSPPSGTPPQIVDTINRIETLFQQAGGSSSVPVGTYFRGANTTQYGGHSSLAMEGTTGSANTGKASGAAALVVSAGLDAPLANGGPVVLQPDETREILEQTAERVTVPNTAGTGSPDPGADPSLPRDEQWTSHFGWGRVDLGAAVALAQSGRIPPEAAIDSPDWFAPLTGATLNVTGLARARFATDANKSFQWKLMWAPGIQPAAGSWQVAGTGSSPTGATVTSFASIDLNAVRTALASMVVPPDTGGPTFAGANPYQQQFTVQLEVTGTGIKTTGIDRRVFTAFTDPSLRAGYPKRMGTGGEAPVRYADLNGDNVQELIVPTEDGVVHAYEPDGSELAGWPVHTGEQAAAIGHETSPALGAIGAPNEPPRAPVVADLDGTGHPDVITVAGTHVYAWHGNGTPVAGFPASEDLANCGPAFEHQSGDVTQQQRAKCGFLASPAVAHLEGYDQPLDIVAPSLDGHLYAFERDGTTVPGYPVLLRDPSVANNHQIAESINDPAIGNLGLPGENYDDVVVATNEEYGAPGGSSDISFSGALASAAGGSTRVYAIDGKSGQFLPNWPIAVPGIIQNVLPLVGPGNDPSIATIGGAPQIITSATGGSLTETAPSGTQTQTMQQNAYGPASNATDKSGSLNLFEGASVGDLLGTGTPDVVKYQATLGAAANLLLVGQNVAWNHLIGAWDGSSGAPLPAFPTVTDDYQFLSSSDIVKVDTGPTASGPTNQVLAGTGLGLLHAYDGATGQDVTGFPKQTGGWLFSPATLSTDGRMADITREGYLFEWKVSQPACQSQWPTFRHDPHDSGNYNHDGTPPASPAQVSLTGLGGNSYTLSFRSPGNDGFCGTAAHYVTRVDGSANGAPDLGTPPAGASSVSRTITLPTGARSLSLQADDGANGSGVVGNLGAPATLAVPGPGQTTTGGGTATGLPAGAPFTSPSAAQPPASPGGSGSGILPKLGGFVGNVPSAALLRCLARRTPTSRLGRRGAHVSRRGLILRGTSSEPACDATHAGRVVKVFVSIARATGRLCRFVARNGRLSPPQSCRRARYLRARGTAHWSLHLSHSLAAGRYQLFVRGVDAAGHTERRDSHRNFLRLRLR